MSAKKIFDSEVDKLWATIPKKKTPGTAQVPNKFWKSFSSGDVLLEVGSGSGRLVAECEKRCLGVVAVDINKNELQQLSKVYNSYPKANFVYADVTKKFKALNIKFDGMLMLGLLGALKSSGDRERALLNCSYHLSRGARVVVSEFKFNDNDGILADRYRLGLQSGLEKGSFQVLDDSGSVLYITHNFTKDELVNLIKSVLRVDEVIEKDFTSYHGNKRKGIIILATKE